MSKFLKIAGLTALICLPAVLYATFATPPSKFRDNPASKHVSAPPVAVTPTGPNGCWEVVAQPSDTAIGVSATWHQICPEGAALHQARGESELPLTPFFLDSGGSGVPDMTYAHLQAELSPALSFSDDFEAALLYLPMTSAGHGVFVAVWSGESAEDTVSRGMKLGPYGARPTSVETSAGRVFMAPPSDTILELESAAELVRGDEPDHEEAGER